MVETTIAVAIGILIAEIVSCNWRVGVVTIWSILQVVLTICIFVGIALLL